MGLGNQQPSPFKMGKVQRLSRQRVQSKWVGSAFHLFIDDDIVYSVWKHIAVHKERSSINDTVRIHKDYTKNIHQAIKALEIPNYHVTFSRSETNEVDCLKALSVGINVAVVFRNKLPKTWNGFDVIDGDETDARFLDRSGVVVGLTAKGKGKKDKTGFVVD